jgi:hypothetical protein
MDQSGNEKTVVDEMCCQLCCSTQIAPFAKDKRRSYYQCGNCGLVFVAAADFLTVDEEKKVYDQHQNNPSDSNYRKFLNRLCAPLVAQVPPHSRGLDFGSGPGPTLALMLAERGHSVAIYDYFYAPDPTVWDERYDFITATEVVEHLHHPGVELERLWFHLKPGGTLGIMTKMVQDVEAFATWHYKNDPTHVSFFSVLTFKWLAQQWRAKINFFAADVVIFTKQD